MPADRFYEDLPVLEDFSGVCDLGNYRELPDDWDIVVGDVCDSTGAIRAGLYKGVNVLGVSIITAVQNAVAPVAVPYMFGGDGASLCVPGHLVPRVRNALVACRHVAEQQFGLRLRVGIVPGAAVRHAGRRVLVARHRVSKYMVHAAFAGGGIEHAETLIKDPRAGSAYLLEGAATPADADFSGLECRWQAVPSRHGETISLIVKALAPTVESAARFYEEIISAVRLIYGDDDACRPIHGGGLHFSYDPKNLRFECGVRSHGGGRTAWLKRLALIYAQNLLGWLFMTFRLHAGGVPWGDYKPDLVLNTDFRKFDGVLRAVLAGTPAQRRELEEYLEAHRRRGECVFGIHASGAAIFTCLITRRHGDHLHFVDGADGGYAIAAAAMKAQLRDLAERVSA